MRYLFLSFKRLHYLLALQTLVVILIFSICHYTESSPSIHLVKNYKSCQICKNFEGILDEFRASDMIYHSEVTNNIYHYPELEEEDKSPLIRVSGSVSNMKYMVPALFNKRIIEYCDELNPMHRKLLYVYYYISLYQVAEIVLSYCSYFASLDSNNLRFKIVYINVVPIIGMLVLSFIFPIPMAAQLLLCFKARKSMHLSPSNTSEIDTSMYNLVVFHEFLSIFISIVSLMHFASPYMKWDLHPEIEYNQFYLRVWATIFACVFLYLFRVFSPHILVSALLHIVVIMRHIRYKLCNGSMELYLRNPSILLWNLPPALASSLWISNLLLQYYFDLHVFLHVAS